MSGSCGWKRFEFEVQKLVELDADRRISQAEWDEVARAVSRLVRQNAEIADLAPEDFWHFLGDFDIRRRDPGYAEAQLKRLRDAMAKVSS